MRRPVTGIKSVKGNQICRHEFIQYNIRIYLRHSNWLMIEAKFQVSLAQIQSEERHLTLIYSSADLDPFLTSNMLINIPAAYQRVMAAYNVSMIIMVESGIPLCPSLHCDSISQKVWLQHALKVVLLRSRNRVKVKHQRDVTLFQITYQRNVVSY